MWEGKRVTVLRMDALTQGSASGDVQSGDKSQLGVLLAFGRSIDSQHFLWALLWWDLINT